MTPEKIRRMVRKFKVRKRTQNAEMMHRKKRASEQKPYDHSSLHRTKKHRQTARLQVSSPDRNDHTQLYLEPQ